MPATATRREAARAKKAPRPKLNIGAANPFALAEVRLGRRINWRRVADTERVLEQALGVPYDQLFDPRSNSPIFAGKEVKEDGVSVRSDPPVSVEGTAWVDPGDFFEETAEYHDPVQGAVGDCYLIAALSSVAWSRPYVIAQRTRATGPSAFVDMIEFHDGAKTIRVEVTETVQLNTPGNTYIFCRSSEAGEIWPAIYEKAYAKWKTGHTGDTPNVNLIAGGDPVAACRQLTGLTPSYFDCQAMTADQIYQKVRENSLSRKTFNPMVAWTYCSPPAGIKYSDAHLAGCHAYSILGWHYDGGKKYIVLRNPWGYYEASISVAPGNWLAFDGSFWRTIALAANDGAFALEAATFKKYFDGFGLVK